MSHPLFGLSDFARRAILTAACAVATTACARDQASAARSSATPSPSPAIAATTAAVNAAPAIDLRVSYHTLAIADDGVQRETRHTNHMVRRPGVVWTERELPQALRASLAHGHDHEHAHGPHVGHAHEEAQGAPLRVTRNANGQTQVEVVLRETRRVIEVDPPHYANVGYGGSWDAAYWLVPPAALRTMRPVGQARNGVQRYQGVSGERTTTVDWDMAGQFPRAVERRNTYGTEITRMTAERLPKAAALPWAQAEKYDRGDYSDLLD